MNSQEIEIKKRIAQIKKRRAEEVAKYDLEIEELNLQLIPIENEELYEAIASEFEKDGYPITPTKFGSVIEIAGESCYLHHPAKITQIYHMVEMELLNQVENL